MEKTLIKFDRVNDSFLDHLHINYYMYKNCKFNCDYCFIVGNNRSDRWKSRVKTRIPTLDDQVSVLDNLLKINKKWSLYVYGGEPTEYKHLHDTIEYIIHNKTEHLFEIELQTNLSGSIKELYKFKHYDDFVISPTIHYKLISDIGISEIINRLNWLNDQSLLRRVDVAMYGHDVDIYLNLDTALKNTDYYDKVIYLYNYIETNTNSGGLNSHSDIEDVYTGRFNHNGRYDKILSGLKPTNRELYRLEYDDGTTEVADMNELVTRDISFKGWTCDAGKNLMLVEYTGDWWVCDVKNFKESPEGNLIERPYKFLSRTYNNTKCNMNKCDGCFYIKKLDL